MENSYKIPGPTHKDPWMQRFNLKIVTNSAIQAAILVAKKFKLWDIVFDWKSFFEASKKKDIAEFNTIRVLVIWEMNVLTLSEIAAISKGLKTPRLEWVKYFPHYKVGWIWVRLQFLPFVRGFSFEPCNSRESRSVLPSAFAYGYFYWKKER